MRFRLRTKEILLAVSSIATGLIGNMLASSFYEGSTDFALLATFALLAGISITFLCVETQDEKDLANYRAMDQEVIRNWLQTSRQANAKMEEAFERGDVNQFTRWRDVRDEL